ncbi:uncharacterized protein B0H18DRAFT_957034 [Fomitopsis serialis]|uniref:uncharacterized protein n=1 Tax=Fomitopsis serialis TaxID=139415 RepID=UPI0020081B51|nr:uncharacterized protein B0H18DRAFT_957034 [Neoantrodia serialis]KAH9920436.1 hypothetical protein B0H18DRAFT_957034 [Neoantrodia serialis]
MHYSAVISAVLIAAAAAPALAAPSGLGLRAVEEDALAQRSFDDELYARDLIFRRAEKHVKPPAKPKPRRQNALLIRPRPGSKTRNPNELSFPEKNPVHDPHNSESKSRPKLRALDDSDEYLLARATEEDKLFARAWEDAVFARLDMDDLN